MTINSLDNLRQFMTDMGQSEAIYWEILHKLIPIIQHTRKYTYQKEIAQYLNIHPAKLSMFLTITKGLAPKHTYMELQDISQLDIPDIDIDAIKLDIEKIFTKDK